MTILGVEGAAVALGEAGSTSSPRGTGGGRGTARDGGSMWSRVKGTDTSAELTTNVVQKVLAGAFKSKSFRSRVVSIGGRSEKANDSSFERGANEKEQVDAFERLERRRLGQEALARAEAAMRDWEQAELEGGDLDERRGLLEESQHAALTWLEEARERADERVEQVVGVLHGLGEWLSSSEMSALVEETLAAEAFEYGAEDEFGALIEARKKEVLATMVTLQRLIVDAAARHARANAGGMTEQEIAITTVFVAELGEEEQRNFNLATQSASLLTSKDQKIAKLEKSHKRSKHEVAELEGSKKRLEGQLLQLQSKAAAAVDAAATAAAEAAAKAEAQLLAVEKERNALIVQLKAASKSGGGVAAATRGRQAGGSKGSAGGKSDKLEATEVESGQEKDGDDDAGAGGGSSLAMEALSVEVKVAKATVSQLRDENDGLRRRAEAAEALVVRLREGQPTGRAGGGVGPTGENHEGKVVQGGGVGGQGAGEGGGGDTGGGMGREAEERGGVEAGGACMGRREEVGGSASGSKQEAGAAAVGQGSPSARGQHSQSRAEAQFSPGGCEVRSVGGGSGAGGVGGGDGGGVGGGGGADSERTVADEENGVPSGGGLSAGDDRAGDGGAGGGVRGTALIGEGAGEAEFAIGQSAAAARPEGVSQHQQAATASGVGCSGAAAKGSSHASLAEDTGDANGVVGGSSGGGGVNGRPSPGGGDASDGGGCGGGAGGAGGATASSGINSEKIQSVGSGVGVGTAGVASREVGGSVQGSAQGRGRGTREAHEEASGLGEGADGSGNGLTMAAVMALGEGEGWSHGDSASRSGASNLAGSDPRSSGGSDVSASSSTVSSDDGGDALSTSSVCGVDVPPSPGAQQPASDGASHHAHPHEGTVANAQQQHLDGSEIPSNARNLSPMAAGAIEAPSRRASLAMHALHEASENDEAPLDDGIETVTMVARVRNLTKERERQREALKAEQVHVRVLLDDLRQADAYSAAVGKTVRALLQIRATEAAKAEAATATTMAAKLAMAGAAAAEGGAEAANEVAMAAAEMAAAAARHKHVAAGKGLGEVSPEGAYAAALTAPQHRSPLTARQPSLSLQEQLRSLQAEQEEELRHFQHLQHAHQQMAESNRLSPLSPRVSLGVALMEPAGLLPRPTEDEAFERSYLSHWLASRTAAATSIPTNTCRNTSCSGATAAAPPVDSVTAASSRGRLPRPPHTTPKERRSLASLSKEPAAARAATASVHPSGALTERAEKTVTLPYLPNSPYNMQQSSPCGLQYNISQNLSSTLPADLERFARSASSLPQCSPISSKLDAGVSPSTTKSIPSRLLDDVQAGRWLPSTTPLEASAQMGLRDFYAHRPQAEAWRRRREAPA